MIDTRPADMSWRYQNKKDIKPSAQRCRRLLGALDHDQAAVDFKRDMVKQQREDSEKYDFDFVNYKPVIRQNKRYDWQAIKVTQPEEPTSRNDDDEVLSKRGVGCDTPSKTTMKRGMAESPSTTQRTLSEFFPKRKRLTPSNKGTSPKHTGIRKILTPKIRAPLFPEHSSSESSPNSSP